VSEKPNEVEPIKEKKKARKKPKRWVIWPFQLLELELDIRYQQS